jgi:hypothetical protein
MGEVCIFEVVRREIPAMRKYISKKCLSAEAISKNMDEA